MKLDLTDMRILDALQHNGKLTMKELAASMGLSITPVYERIKYLEKHNYIRKYVALIDRKKIGKEIVVFASVTLTSHQRNMIEQFEREILPLKEVMECYHMAGVMDYLLKVCVDDMDAYQRFVVKRLAAMENISQVHSWFILDEIKTETSVPIHIPDLSVD
ncbi:Lrp/AsnC family transcriptional regulator [Marinigracilibium pacificum]|uniref:Lrp/AsnC family transcriptional regulator n=1 Tax=Marinigracilibium pacificum TaxID=2729599 RepID=A0A848J170_9BACT|nr:Lrp/AsnC family transcriptional regulator [Marinigracilibium pacificum]NMM46982.1 Lrp/AsnC family transcriptional regulator [Marinigracilibium pacificum]